MKKLILLSVILSTSLFAGSFEDELLKTHNNYRKKHSATALVWDKKIQKYAQSWANKLAKMGKMQHRQPNKYGENLYASYGQAVDGVVPVKSWYDEIKDYNFNKQGFSMETGHFTQVVWKGSTKLGCGKAKSKKTGWTYVVCNYDPPGNYMGEFEKNVSKD